LWQTLTFFGLSFFAKMLAETRLMIEKFLRKQERKSVNLLNLIDFI